MTVRTRILSSASASPHRTGGPVSLFVFVRFPPGSLRRRGASGRTEDRGAGPALRPVRRRRDVVRAGRDPRRRAGQRGRGSVRTTGDDRRRRHAGAGGRGEGGGAAAGFPGEGLRPRGRVPVGGDRGSDGGRRRAADGAPRPRGRHRRDHRPGAAGVRAVPVRLPGGILAPPMGGDDRRVPVGPEGPPVRVRRRRDPVEPGTGGDARADRRPAGDRAGLHRLLQPGEPGLRHRRGRRGGRLSRHRDSRRPRDGTPSPS